MASGWSAFRPYVSAAKKKARAARALAKLAKGAKGGGKKGRAAGRAPEPVVIDGRAIARTFWGKAWCENLESYADFAYRLERGRTYVRSGAVIDLELAPGVIRAKVCGTDVYEVNVTLAPLGAPKWQAIARRCTGQIASLVALLRGELPDGVMTVVTEPREGLFPEPKQLRVSCTCPDWAGVCKHVAAALYGVGARLDARPELLFQLRGVDPQDLVAEMPVSHVGAAAAAPGPDEDLGALFGIELDGDGDGAHGARPGKPRRRAKMGAAPPPVAKTSPPQDRNGARAPRKQATAAAAGRPLAGAPRRGRPRRQGLPASLAPGPARGSTRPPR
jgi:hypothetical protein